MNADQIKYQDSNTDDEILLRDLIGNIALFIKYLKKKWLVLFAGSFMLAAVAGGYAFLQKSQYVAALSFVLEEEKASTGGGLSSIASQFGIDMGSSSSGVFSQANLIELIKSRELIENALIKKIVFKGKTTTLADIYLDSSDLRKGVKQQIPKDYFLSQPDKEQFLPEQATLLRTMYKSVFSNLDVAPKDKKTSIIVVEFKNPNETFSKLFVDNLVQTVSDFYIKTKSQKSQINVEILERQVDSLRASLNSAISGVALTVENTFNANPALSLIKTPSVRRQIDVQTNSAMLAQVMGSLEMAKISLRKETPLYFILDRPVLPLLREKPSTIKYFFVTGIITFFLISFILGIRFFWKHSNNN
ncbi:MAG: lipopolysaccharide biosynthesis protein [Bacteroidetes bacterium]|nr:lipopolysaccharide biosynthesis protein [Bacteroidota bacterium]